MMKKANCFNKQQTNRFSDKWHCTVEQHREVHLRVANFDCKQTTPLIACSGIFVPRFLNKAVICRVPRLRPTANDGWVC
jgi:hypothetical protein